ncbi:flagellin [Limnohabitans sp.]|uniref:flagellin N-terminal helical domain-containing protein n=1 Tax=Limnohabitans sp. TaxID=1907725 RepID=UPI0039BC9068
MSLTVRTNTSALLAQESLRSNQSKVSTAMQRLSTGLRINNAKDDAAGLAIVNKMTSQIRGSSQAIRNIQDGISLIKTAESALGSITDLLQRMRELTIQASTDTYSDEQRYYLHLEAMEIQKEILRLKESTTWNGKKLLDGSFINQKLQIGANKDHEFPVSISGIGLSDIGLVGSVGQSYSGGVTESAKINFTSLQLGQSITLNGLNFTASKNITENEVASAFSNMTAGAKFGQGSSYGEYDGTLKNYSTASANGSELIASSVISNINVSDISISTNGVDKLVLPNIATVQGNIAVEGKGTINEIKFYPLQQSQSITIDNLRFTANKFLTAEEVAIAFSNINGGVTPGPSSNNGTFSGGLFWSYDSSSTIGDTVIFTNSIHRPGSQILNRGEGMRELELPSISTTQGAPIYAGNPEVAEIEFTDLQPNQTITIWNNNKWLSFRASTSLNANQVATIFANRESNNYFAYSSLYGSFNTSGDPFSTGPANGKIVKFTSNYLMQAPISAYTTANPQPIVSTITQGASPTGATEEVKISFSAMYTGQWLSIGGLRFTANKPLTTDEVASAFSGISPSDTTGPANSANGRYSGTFRSDFSTSTIIKVPYIAQGNQYFKTIINVTSTNSNTNVTDLEISGSTAVESPQNLPLINFTQGISDILALTEKNTLTFSPMKIGQSLEISGLKFTATSSLNATEVALAYSNLTSGNTTGPQQNSGAYSGSLSGFRSGLETDNKITFTSVITNTNTPDISLFTGDSISAPSIPSAVITQGFTDGVSLITTGLAQLSIDRINYAINNIGSQRSILGSNINALTHIGDNLINLNMNLESSRSSINDTNYAIETTNLAKAQIIE